MEYIISKGSKLPTTKSEMERFDWFNIWSKKQFPYDELLIGDILYWLDNTKKKLMWKTQVVDIERYPYSDKKVIFEKHPYVESKDYFDLKKNKGFFIGYKVSVLDKVDFEKPRESFPRLGWEKLDKEKAQLWFAASDLSDQTVLDDTIALKNTSSLIEKIIELNDRMQFVSPKRIKELMSNTIRNDTSFIRMLKEAANYKCQYPGCGHQIKTKNNGYYIEVAHIASVKEGGQSVLGNLIVLCPNHHKEFDYGLKEIIEQTMLKLKGKLNGCDFDIVLDFNIGNNY